MMNRFNHSLVRGFLILMFMATAAGAEDQGGFVYDDHGKRDPLWELVNVAGTINNYETDFIISDISLEGIITDPTGKNIAMLNGRIVTVGDKIGQYAVTEITATQVTLTKDGQTSVLQLQRGE